MQVDLIPELTQLAKEKINFFEELREASVSSIYSLCMQACISIDER